jgi:thiol-disulfide isomerase/thioredoxin
VIGRLRGPLLAAGVLSIVLLTGCAETAVVSGDSSVDNTITEIPISHRGAPIVFSGTLDTGGTANSTDWQGSVVVVNFWYAACPPCRAEAPDLEALYKKYSPKGVVFVGVKVRDTTPTARSFAKNFGISYPSIMDNAGGAVQLAFHGRIAPNAVPTTIVLDRQGRAASRILGRIPSQLTLGTLIDAALAERTTP